MWRLFMWKRVTKMHESWNRFFTWIQIEINQRLDGNRLISDNQKRTPLPGWGMRFSYALSESLTTSLFHFDDIFCCLNGAGIDIKQGVKKVDHCAGEDDKGQDWDNVIGLFHCNGFSGLHPRHCGRVMFLLYTINCRLQA